MYLISKEHLYFFCTRVSYYQLNMCIFAFCFLEDRKTFHSQDRKIFLFSGQKRYFYTWDRKIFLFLGWKTYFYSQDRLALLFLGKEIFLFLGKKDISIIRKQTQANELQHQTSLCPGGVSFKMLYAIGKAPCIQTLYTVIQNVLHFT